MIDILPEDTEELVFYVIFDYFQMGASEEQVYHLIYEYCIENVVSIEIPRLETLITTAFYVHKNREILLDLWIN